MTSHYDHDHESRIREREHRSLCLGVALIIAVVVIVFCVVKWCLDLLDRRQRPATTPTPAPPPQTRLARHQALARAHREDIIRQCRNSKD